MTKIISSIIDFIDPSHPFWAHFFSGIPLVGMSLFLCLLALKRANNLPQKQCSFSEVHIPEKDLNLLNNIGKVVTVYTFLVMTTTKMDHAGIILPHAMWGITAMIESRACIPLDTNRVVFAIGNFIQFLTMYDHAMMKTDPSDFKLHVCQAFSFLITGVIMLYSIHRPTSTAAYIAGWASIALEGTWSITDAFILIAGNDTVNPHMVYTYFGGQILAITMTVIIGTACFVPNHVATGTVAPDLNLLLTKGNQPNDTFDEEEDESVPMVF